MTIVNAAIYPLGNGGAFLPSGRKIRSGSSMKFVSTGDLVTRWKYTRQGINQLSKKPEFPPPVFRLNNDRLPVWELSAIEAFERDRPELGDEHQKYRKRNGYFAAIMKGDRKRAEQ